MAIVIRNGDTADHDLMINILRTVDPSRHPTVHITFEGYDSARYTSEYLLWAVFQFRSHSAQKVIKSWLHDWPL